jgi:hypothetical protein
MAVVNTTCGPVEVGSTAYEQINTSRIIEEDMSFEDEETEIISVLPATGWQAVIEDPADTRTIPLVVWVAEDTGRLYGVGLGEDGRIDLVENDVEKLDGFFRYEQINNEKEQNNG